MVLEGIVCQSLLPKVNGEGRVVSMEILVPTPGIRNLIREDKIHQIYSAMQTGQEKLGMQTMNQSLATLYFRRQISLETAMSASSITARPRRRGGSRPAPSRGSASSPRGR